MVVSKSRSSASLTVIAPVPALMANGRLPSLVPVGVPAGDGPLHGDVVVAGVVDVDDGIGVGGGLGEVGRGVRDGDADVGDRDRDVLGVGRGAVGGPHGQRVAGGRLEVEVVRVVDGDRARARVDGERQVAVLVAVGVAGGDRPGEALVVAGRGDGDDRGAVGGGLGEVGRGVRDGRRDVGDRDGDDLGVGGRAVGGLDREVVAGGRLEVEVVRVVDGDRARARVDGERQVAVAVPVGVAGGDRPGEALVVAGRGDGDDRGAVGGGLGEVGRGVRDGRGDVGDRDGDDLGVGGGAVGGLDREVVAGGRLEVEVVRVVDGDGAGARIDGERQVAVAVPVGVAGGDRPGEALVVAGRGDGDDRGAVGGGLGEVGRGVRDGRGDVGDRDRDVLGVGRGAVGGPHGQRVAGGRLEVEVLRVVDGDGARARIDGERQVAVLVPVGVAGGDRPGEALVVAGRGDGDDRIGVGGALGEVRRGVRDGRRDVGDRDGDDLGVGLCGAVGGLDREVVAGGRLEVEVVRVVDGDRARARVDGERKVAVAVAVGVPAGDGPLHGDVVVAGVVDVDDGIGVGGGLGEVGRGVRDGDGDVGDRDGDDLGVGGRAVGGLDREVVGGGRLEVEVVRVVDGDGARARS